VADLGAQLAAWGKASGNSIAGLQGIHRFQFNQAGHSAAPPSFTIGDQTQTFELSVRDIREAVDFHGPGSKSGPALDNTPTRGDFDQRGGAVVFTMPVGWVGQHQHMLAIQLACAGTIILAFALLMWWTLNRPRIVEFTIATEAEMRKVNWPTRHEVLGSTWVVICGTIILAVFLFGCDSAFFWFFKQIKIIH
jgi:preprotein translocase SecE subunit